MGKKLISTYKFSPANVSPSLNQYPNAVNLLQLNEKYIIEEVIAYINYNVTNNIAPFIFYTYNEAKCRRDTGYVLEGILNDLKKGGNTATRYNASTYWLGGVAQLDGDREPELAVYEYVKVLLTNYIFNNVAFASRNAVIAQTITGNNAEGAGETRFEQLIDIIIDVIQGGLDNLPALVNTRGTIKFPGFFKLKDFLLITNTTKNVILYNFADPTNKLELTYQNLGNINTDTDADFPGSIYGIDKITTAILDADTSTMLGTDNIQIFVEAKEDTVRLNSIATDAMERVKVGLPQSMLDADFEYGLQPTKWQAVGLQRNYPATYEIPGSEILVTTVTTDASSATGGSGASLITVTCQSAHSLIVGDAFSIKALANSITGFSRAEGTFLVNSVPSINIFTYYAKAKVGTTDGQQLASVYTQLRKAAYYTGAAVGNPSFSVFSNGTSGNITTTLITPAGSTVIGYTGTAPLIGSPLTGTGLNTGTSVTNVTGSGTTTASTTLAINADAGDTVLTVNSTTGIATGQILNRGDGVQTVVTNINNNDVTFSEPITSDILGTNETFTTVSQSSTSGDGVNAQFTISRASSVYSATVTNQGLSYSNGDTITVNGNLLSGNIDSTNKNATITVVSALSRLRANSLDAATLVGGTGYSNTNGEVTTNVSGSGSGLTVDITSVAGVVTALAINNGGSNYTNGTVVRVRGGASYNGVTPNNITSFTGADATFDITRSNTGVYSVQINNIGTGFSAGLGSGETPDTLTFIGTSLGGEIGVNNLIITVLSVDSSGGILTFSTSGTGSTGSCKITVNGVSTGGEIQSVSIAGTAVTAPTLNFLSAITISEPTTSQIASGNTGITFSAIGTILVTFLTAHGFVPGNIITTFISSSGVNAKLAEGAFFVEEVPTETTLKYTARSAGAIENNLVGILYGRSDAFFIHRPFDGGVILGTASPSHGANAIRMSKKYIRYQSGKGVMYNTGALFAPSYDVRSVTANGTAVGSTITIETDDVDHGCQVGGIITLSGVTTSGYDSTYTVTSIVTERTLRVLANKTLGSATPTLSSPCVIGVRNWHGATVRAGIFDDQNGMFWQYDGQKFAVGRRTSTQQLAGVVSVTPNSNLVTGTNTKFRDQLIAGDKIVIRGMSHVVSRITSNTSMTVTPDFRGVVVAPEVKIVKTTDIIIPQSDFNLDAINGSGQSGYTLDIGKMQMIGIQHTWYGAGFIDFMLRGSEGNYVFVHRFRNSNTNTEAYMRTGNLPVRYEVENVGSKGRLLSNINSSVTSIPLSADDLEFFPNSGTVYVDNELINYTKKSSSALENCTRSAALTQFVAGSNRSFTGSVAESHTAGTGVILVSNTITPNISHWGSAFLTDGRFDEDRGYIFNYLASGINVTTERTTAFLLRLAPSVSNAVTGDLGEKELLNRAQLLLNSVTCVSDTGTGAIVIEGVLNPANYPTDPTKITWTGLQNAAAGGQPSFAQVASGGSVTWSGSSSQTTANTLGAFTTTITARAFNADTASLTAIGFNNPSVTLTARSFAFATSSTYNRAFSTTRNDFLITMADYNTLLTTNPLLVGDRLSTSTYLTSSQRIASITPNFITLAGTAHARIVMTANANNNSPQASVNGGNNITLSNFNNIAESFNSAINSGRSTFIITQTQATAISLQTGDVFSLATYLTSGQSLSSVTSNYVLIGSVQYALVQMTSTGNATSPGGTNQTVVRTKKDTATYGAAFNTNRNDFLVTDADFNSSGILAGDGLDTLTAGTTLSGVTVASGGILNFTSNATLSVGSKITITGTYGGTGSITGYVTGNSYFITATNGTTQVTLSATYNGGPITTSAGTPTGLTYTVITPIISNVTIISITPSFVSIGGTAHTRILMSNPPQLVSGTGSANSMSVRITAAGSASSLTRTNYLFFSSTQWLNSGAVIGTRFASSVTSFPAATSVTAITTRTFLSGVAYRVTFTQSSTTTISASTTLTFQFGAQYALPGETVFSFVVQPGTSETLTLDTLKELTATTIGGRGAFPNGPDTLAFNVYKVSGTAVNSNIILRWGEAQA
jgi:hypothetical protein